MITWLTSHSRGAGNQKRYGSFSSLRKKDHQTGKDQEGARIFLPTEQLDAAAGIVDAIQLAIAPVFLFTGIAGLLSVLSLRLGRVIDRARVIDRRLFREEELDEKSSPLVQEARLLWWRIRLINWAIRLAVASALFVCLVVISLFLGALITVNNGPIVAFSFMTAMALIFLCLLVLLVEVSASTLKMRQRLEYTLGDLN